MNSCYLNSLNQQLHQPQYQYPSRFGQHHQKGGRRVIQCSYEGGLRVSQNEVLQEWEEHIHWSKRGFHIPADLNCCNKSRNALPVTWKKIKETEWEKWQLENNTDEEETGCSIGHYLLLSLILHLHKCN